jgi:arylsulfatase A-like enzyme
VTHKKRVRVLSLLSVLSTATVLSAVSIEVGAQELPRPTLPFEGTIGESRDQSTPGWPREPQAPAGAPNIVIVLLDDVGFGAASVFGGPASTPALEKLAQGGLRYNSFHVNALCSPTRAALLTGRNNHQVGFGVVTNGFGYPGYNTVWKPEYASYAQVLRQNGYSTAAFGKWHNTPIWEISPAGPFDRWPSSLGFEYFYGFLAGSDNQFEPRLYRNTVAVEPARTAKQGYNLNNDLANESIRWLHSHEAVSAEKPFLLYIAPGATHQPHHVTQDWIDKYRGQFDQGWDKLREQTFARQKQLGVIPANARLTPRPKELPPWSSIDAEQRKLLTREAEVYAAFLSQTDHEIGRVLDAIREEGKWDNTLVFYIVGDNGAEAAGGLSGQDLRTATNTPETDIAKRVQHLAELGTDKYSNLYASGWAWGMDTPFQWSKQVASHLGGTTDPLIVSWPAKIHDRGGLRPQFQHVNDIAATIYDVTGIKPPLSVNGIKQAPLEGASFAYTFDDPKAASRHTQQYFEMLGNRGIYQDGWWAGARYLLPWDRSAYDTLPIDQHPWELYNLKEDFSQAHDLAKSNPTKLKELQALFESEAQRNGVYPLIPHNAHLPSPADGKTSFTYYGDVDRIPINVAPTFGAHHHVLTADIIVPESGAEGVLIAEGGVWGGFSLYVKNDHVIYENNSAGTETERIVSTSPLPRGKVRIVFEYTPDGKVLTKDKTYGRDVTAGSARLSINDAVVGQAQFKQFGSLNATETLDIGRDLGTAVSTDYEVPFAFTGQLENINLVFK